MTIDTPFSLSLLEPSAGICASLFQALTIVGRCVDAFGVSCPKMDF